MTYIVRTPVYGGTPMIRTTDDIDVRYAVTYRAIDRSSRIPVVELAGPDRTRLQIAGGGRDSFGRVISADSYCGMTTTTIRVGEVRHHVRILSAVDADDLSDIDRDIAELEARLTTVRIRRGELVKSAWRRAKAVPTIDLTDMADATQETHD